MGPDRKGSLLELRNIEPGAAEPTSNDLKSWALLFLACARLHSATKEPIGSNAFVYGALNTFSDYMTMKHAPGLKGNA